jgi:ATP:ADP antiporter, AAA family
MKLSFNLRKPFSLFLSVPFYEGLKIALLTAAFFCIIGCYTILRELRDTLFVYTVGKRYLQYGQITSMLLLVPALFIYSYLVDRLKKHQLIYAYTLFYGLGTIAMAFSVGHPTFGLANTTLSSDRVFGWVQYLFIEGFAPFVVSLFFAFINSVTPLKSAPQSYSIIVAGSKFGGMVIAAFSWFFMSNITWSDSRSHQFLLFVAAALILIVPILVYLLIKWVPEKYFHGYEAAYRVDRKIERQHLQEDKTVETRYRGLTHYVARLKLSLNRSLSGLTLMIRYPYALGMFGLVFFWEIISVVLNYQQLGVCMGLYTSATKLSAFLFLQIFWVHTLGCILALIGTRAFLAVLGERLSLVSIPILTGFLATVYFLNGATTVALIAFVLIRALNYSVALSVREALFIPTTKEVRFKTKSWIDAFGAKFARGSGSLYNLFTDRFGITSVASHLSFCLGIMLFWISTAHLLGKRFEEAVKNNEVIG